MLPIYNNNNNNTFHPKTVSKLCTAVINYLFKQQYILSSDEKNELKVFDYTRDDIIIIIV